jgi:transcriptional regulator with XRE-family HTH domain
VLRHMHYPITKDTLKQRLAKKVRALRKKLGLTLKAAAERAEMHWRHWQKVEAAQVNVTLLTLVRLGDALNIDPRELIAA